MTQIVQAGSINILALGSPKAVVQIQTPDRPIIGVQTNILGLIGIASWGPVNVATVVSGNDDQYRYFGPITNRKFDLSTAVAVAVDQFCSSMKNVRVTDGTDAAASGTYASSETFATETVGGVAHVGDVLTLVFTPAAGSPITVTFTMPSTPTLTQGATGLAAAINANAALVAAGFAATSLVAVVSIYCPGGVAPGTGWTSITPSVTGGGATTTLTGGTSTASTIKLTLTGYYTGVVGNGLVPTVQAGTAASSIKITIGRPGFTAEVFDNIIGLGNLMWVNAALAINNGNAAIRGPSVLCTATAGLGGAGVPGTAATITMAGGLDGTTTITDATLLGVDTLPRKGLYALRNQGISVACPVDASLSTYWSNYSTFGLGEGVQVEAASPAGDTITAAATELSTAGVDSYAFKLDFGDWIYWWDDVNSTLRLLSPATFLAAKRANMSPEQSVLNKYMNNIVGSQKTLTGGVWSDADKDALYAARMDLLCNPVPGGSYWASNNGVNSSSNAAINGDNYTMLTNFIAKSVARWAGSNIGLLQTPDQRRSAKAVIDDFFNAMWQLGMIGNASSAFGQGLPPWSTAIDDITTPPTLAAQGYEIAAVRVQYLAVIRWFILNLMGGQTVQVRVSQTSPSFVTQR
jgi:hypothetical protein